MSGSERSEVNAELDTRVGGLDDGSKKAGEKLNTEAVDGFRATGMPEKGTNPAPDMNLVPLYIDDAVLNSSNGSIDRDGDGSEFDDMARQRLGEPTWLKSPYRNALHEGRRSGADFVSQVIKDYMGHKDMDPRLYDIGGQRLSFKLDASPDFKQVNPAEAKPGDILIGFRREREVEQFVPTVAGIVDSNNKLQVNSNRDGGRIIEYSLDRMLRSPHLQGGFRAYRPPAERSKK